MKITLILLSVLYSSLSLAQELVIRADINKPKSLPTWSKMPSVSPACNDGGVAAKYLSFFGNENLHPALVQKSFGKNIFSDHFSSDLSISDLHFTKDEKVIFALNFRGGTEGVYSFDKDKKTRQLVDPKDFPNTSAMSRPSLVGSEVLFRSLNKNGLHTVYLGSKKILNEEKEIAYLYLPTVKKDQIVLKIGYGVPGEVSQQNQDKIVSIQNTIRTVVAVDKDFDSKSKFLSFDNSPIPDGEGGVAFVADHETHGRSLWLYKNQKMSLVFSGKNSLYELEYFSPDLNSSGSVVFGEP